MNTKSIIAFSAVAVAFALLVAPLAAVSVDAYSSTKQTINMKQYASSSSSCTAVVCTASGNGFAANFQFNTGNQISR